MHPLWKILVLFALLAFGTILAAVGILLIGLIQGVDPNTLMSIMMEGEGDFPPSMLRSMLWLQAIAGFLIPGAIFIRLYNRNNWKTYFGLGHFPSLRIILLGILALFAAYPLVQLAFSVNSMIPLPEWVSAMEDNTADVMREILKMESTGAFLLTLLLVGILPGIGEELIFRGILQKQIEEWTSSPVLSVWIAAIIFSAVHMQFEGFLPRMALGAILGFLYLWSRNLWVPMIVHAVNNGAQVAVLYFSGIDLSQLEEEQTMDLNVLMIIGSVVVLYLCYRLITKAVPGHG